MAVLTLSRPVHYAPHISPICLPEAGRDPEPGTTAYVAGWGALIPDDITGNLAPQIELRSYQRTALEPQPLINSRPTHE